MKSQFTGETKVFRNDDKSFPRYSVSIGKKNQSGEWDNVWINVKFKKGVEVENGTIINVENGWLTFRQYESDGRKKTVWEIFISEFEKQHSEFPDSFSATDEDMPF